MDPQTFETPSKSSNSVFSGQTIEDASILPIERLLHYDSAYKGTAHYRQCSFKAPSQMPSAAASFTRPSRRTDASRPPSRRSQPTRAIGTKLECAGHAQLVAQKRRIPLATKCNANGNLAAAPTTLSLPRTLPRPVLAEVDMSSLVSAYPNLAGTPAEYIRDHLPLSTPTYVVFALPRSVNS